MPFGFCGAWYGTAISDSPQPCHGKRRGVTKSPKRAKRRNRKKP